MSRQEFSKSIKVACIKTATRDGIIYCVECHLPTKRFHIDHKDPDGLTGQPTIENAQLLCLPCHLEKTADDVDKIARAKRREAKHLGACPVQSRPIQSQGFPPVLKKPKHPIKPPLPRREMFEDKRS